MLNLRLFATLMAMLLLAGCSTTVRLSPKESPTANADSSCKFATTDLRPNPDLVFARMSDRTKAVDVSPPLAKEIRDRMCGTLGESARLTKTTFFITDYDCYVSGFWTSTFLVEIRGRLVTSDGQQYDVRQSSSSSSNVGWIPGGCQAATVQTLDLLVPKIAAPLDRLSSPRKGEST